MLRHSFKVYTGLAITAILASACATTPDLKPVGFMPSSDVAAAAPAGFIALCRRDPSSCSSQASHQTVERMVEEQSPSSEAYWLTRIRQRRDLTVPSQPAPAVSAQTEAVGPRATKLQATAKRGANTARIVKPSKIDASQARVHLPVLASLNPGSTSSYPGASGIETNALNILSYLPRGPERWPSSSGDASTFAPDPAPPLREQLVAVGSPFITSATPRFDISSPSSVSPDRWAIAAQVNARVNASMRMRTDLDGFGADDVWQLPGQRPAGYGDCEDYVLQKRHDLLLNGFREEDLSIAIVRTQRGEVHAVLLVSSPDGEYVLDNLTAWILPWSAAPYQWIQRQAPGRPLEWIALS